MTAQAWAPNVDLASRKCAAAAFVDLSVFLGGVMASSSIPMPLWPVNLKLSGDASLFSGGSFDFDQNQFFGYRAKRTGAKFKQVCFLMLAKCPVERILRFFLCCSSVARTGHVPQVMLLGHLVRPGERQRMCLDHVPSSTPSQ
eukprot:GHVN01028002.1.p1 GENE.GHVN01028002.1~~GHVN01028002.1.p1  ORF type:complete len:143 (+),score=11.39 GHVN01028002.1:221-649(+)